MQGMPWLCPVLSPRGTCKDRDTLGRGLGTAAPALRAPHHPVPPLAPFPDQPDNPSEENCGVIRTESSGGWQNRDCGIALPYVCKKKPNATADPFLTGEQGG